ncbi:MAG: class I SAM-dependent methyltransferase [Acidobacteriota bacterium]
MHDSARQESERVFHDKVYQRGWDQETERIDERIIPPNFMGYWRFVREIVCDLLESQASVRALDCGCGHGILSVLLARLGLHVTAVDISANAIAIVRHLAEVNEVADRIDARAVSVEEGINEVEAFDCVFGTRVLHHLEIALAGPRIARALKPGGRAVFYECTDRNAILRWSRRYVRRVLPLPKFGTEHEHPLTRDEIQMLARDVGAPVRYVDAPFHFFQLADQYLLRQRFRLVSRLMTNTDAALARCVPILNRFSWHQILDFKKPPRRGEGDVSLTRAAG